MSCTYWEERVRVRISKREWPARQSVGLLILLLASACSRQSVSMALPSDIDPAELKRRIQVPVTVTGEAGTKLTVSPGHVGACTGWERGTSTISWKTDPAQVTSVRVEVSDKTKQSRQVFAGGGSAGEAVAEGWFSEGVTFHVIDATSNRDLTSYTVDALDCVQR